MIQVITFSDHISAKLTDSILKIANLHFFFSSWPLSQTLRAPFCLLERTLLYLELICVLIDLPSKNYD